jgi:hypothetical protein
MIIPARTIGIPETTPFIPQRRVEFFTVLLSPETTLKRF